MATTFTSDWIAHDRVSREAALARLDALSRLFDVAFVIPGTNVRFGIEAILRLVPGIGDAAASALSCWLPYEAHRPPHRDTETGRAAPAHARRAAGAPPLSAAYSSPSMMRKSRSPAWLNTFNAA